MASQSRAPASVVSTVRAVAILAVLALVIWALSDIALLIFMAILLAVMLRGVSDWAAERTSAPASAMLAGVTLAVALLMFGFLFYLGPRLAAQARDLWNQLNQQFSELRNVYGNTPWGKALLSNLSPHELVQGHIANYAGIVASSTLGGAVTALIVIVTALYFAISPGVYIDGTVRLFTLPYRPRARSVLADIGSTLRRWALGQLISMTVVALLICIGLVLLGVRLAFALAALAGLFTFVPYFGAVAAAVPAMLVALAAGWRTSLWVAVTFLVGHGIEGYLVAPLVQRNTTDLPPALTILSMTILGTLFGPLGMILGAPVAAVALVIVREIYVGDVLGENMEPID
jgi:predicted PurR-regulated permease PerM